MSTPDDVPPPPAVAPPQVTPDDVPPPHAVAAPRVLVVEDEPQMRDIVAFVLEHNGYEVATEATADDGWRRFQREHFDAAVLDVMLGEVSGIDLCHRIRSHSRIPVLFLSALSTTEERIAGLEAGADDYLGKPFSPRELALRVARLVQRAASENPELVAGDLRVHVNRPVAALVGKRVELTATSHQILLALVRAGGEPLHWREIVNEVWGSSAPQGGKDMVKTAVYRLRKELGDEEARIIQTVRGKGYCVAGPAGS